MLLYPIKYLGLTHLPIYDASERQSNPTSCAPAVETVPAQREAVFLAYTLWP